MSGIEIIIEDLSDHPSCPHGPTLLFSKLVNNEPKRFYACAACRDRKECEFFLWEDQLEKFKKNKNDHWLAKRKDYIKGINHTNLYLTHNKVLTSPVHERMYCHDCNSFQLPKYKVKHKDHNCTNNISDYLMHHPSEFLEPLDNSKKEAQYLFSKKSINVIIDILREHKLLNVLCIGCPRIHEFISTDCADMSSLLLDFDKRYHNFFSPLEFCWFNLFNDHFFLDDAQDVFTDFLKNKRNLVIVTDPPFGGRIEPIAETFNKITALWKKVNDLDKDLPILWAFPYFMEPQILNSYPNFQMLDYKVDYDNHILFSDGPKGRKQGSPVRLFTNIEECIKLPADEGYKFCTKCNRWVSSENQHCKECNACTSKDGRTYVHCNVCERCVKPTWKHCNSCSKCAQPDHKCGIRMFSQECFNCKQRGHKQKDCPNINKNGKRFNKQKKNKKKILKKCI